MPPYRHLSFKWSTVYAAIKHMILVAATIHLLLIVIGIVSVQNVDQLNIANMFDLYIFFPNLPINIAGLIIAAVFYTILFSWGYLKNSAIKVG